MDVGSFVQTIFHFPGFNFVHGFGNIGSNGTGFGVGHQAAGPQDTTEFTDNAHHIGGSDDNIEIKPVFFGDFFDHVFGANVIRAGGFGFFGFFAFGENEHFLAAAGAVGKNHRASDLLVSLAGVQIQTNMQFNGFVEFRSSGFFQKAECFGRFIQILSVERF